MRDYSQHGEQLHILKFFGEFKGRFLDIGAFDGIEGSNTRSLAELGWTGVAIEANPLVFQTLCAKASKGVSCVNAAVMDQPGLIQMESAGQLSTCLRGNIPKRFVSGSFFVACVTPEMIATQFGAGFDFISLDVEGVDLSVLAELGPVSEQAKLLCIEDSIPCQRFDPEYYNKLRLAAAALGFTKVVARTPDDTGKGNTLLAKE